MTFEVSEAGHIFGNSSTSLPESVRHICDGGGFSARCTGSATEYAPTGDTGFGAPGIGDLVIILQTLANPAGDPHAPFLAGKSTTACDGNPLGFTTNPEQGPTARR